MCLSNGELCQNPRVFSIGFVLVSYIIIACSIVALPISENLIIIRHDFFFLTPLLMMFQFIVMVENVIPLFSKSYISVKHHHILLLHSLILNLIELFLLLYTIYTQYHIITKQKLIFRKCC